MMGYNDGAAEFTHDSFNGRKLRPLMPRPLPNPSRNHINGSDFFSLNQYHHGMIDQTKRDFNTQPVIVSSRWNPTPEQLRTLEELYRRGTRTPSADQIQHITSQLRRYGKIEGKNVFYWFQNHKARERQKRRRQMESTTDEQNCNTENLERKDSGGNKNGYEEEQTKNWTVAIEDSVSAAPMAAKASAAAECRLDGWVPLDNESELQHIRNAMWQHKSHSNNHINYTTTTSYATAPAPLPTTTSAVRSIKTTHDLMNIFFAPYRDSNNIRCDGQDGCGDGDAQTLELFPLRSGGDIDNANQKEIERSIAAMNANLSPPYQFFEFLPVKN